MEEISGYILAGGASSRMGRPKPGLELGGRRLVDIAFDKLSSLCDDVSIVVKELIGDREYRQIQDNVPALPGSDGPLVAIYTALSDTTTEWNFILACDLPMVTSDLLALIASKIDPDTDAIVPVQPDGKIQPLCGLYRRKACVGIALDSLKARKRSPMALIEQVEAKFIAFSDVEDLAGSEDLFLNVNTPVDFMRAVEIYR